MLPSVEARWRMSADSTYRQVSWSVVDGVQSSVFDGPKWNGVFVFQRDRANVTKKTLISSSSVGGLYLI